MKKTDIVLAVAAVGAILYFYLGSSGGQESAHSDVKNDLTAKMVLLLGRDGGGSAAVQSKADVKDSPYFKKVDVYNLKSGGSLLLLENLINFSVNIF